MTTNNEFSAATQRRLGLTMVVISSIIFLVASYLAYDQWQLDQRGLVVTGQVISVGKRNAYPQVRFEAPDRNIYEFKETHYSAFADKVQPGDSIKVIFDPRHPHNAYVVDTRWVSVETTYLFALMIGIFGALCLSKRVRAAFSSLDTGHS